MNDKKIKRLARELADREPVKPCECGHGKGDPERVCCAHSMRLMCCCRARIEGPSDYAEAQSDLALPDEQEREHRAFVRDLADEHGFPLPTWQPQKGESSDR